MKCEWKKATIADLCLTVTDGSHSSPKSVEQGKFMVSVKDFTPYGFNFSGCRKISDADYDQLRKSGCVPEQNDILIGKDGARFFEDIIIYNQPEEPALLSSIAILRPDKSKILPEYLYYTLKTPTYKKDVRENYGSGSAIPRIILKDFKRMPVWLPELAEQKRITEILSSIDQKIKTNSEINDNLQQQAQALFTNLFALQGDKIPEGWKKTTMGDMATIQKKSFNPVKSPEVVLEHYSIPAFDEMRYPVFQLSTEIKSNKFILDGDCFMISKLNPTVKRVWRPICMTSNAVCSTEFIVYKAKNPKMTEFLFSLIDSDEFSDFMRSHVTGSTGSRQRTNPSDTLQYSFYLPTETEICEFSAIVAPMYAQIKVNAMENARLMLLRDTLLPKLMSGELDVSEI